MREARERLKAHFALNAEDHAELIPSGTQTKFDNRVAWSKSYLVQAKVLSSSRRGYFRITDRGRALLRQGHERIDIKILNQYPEFVDFHKSPAQDRKAPASQG